jgi:hypothetical protein
MTPDQLGDAAREVLRERLSVNLQRVRERMASAAARAGRQAEEIRLVAVTKKIPLHVVRILAELGLEDFGENRPEEVPGRAQDLISAGFRCRWHMIGHYQRRKVAATVSALHMVHSVHSARLLEALASAGGKASVLLQVNVSGEGSKQGFSATELEILLNEARGALPRIDIVGLMTMTPIGCPPDRLRGIFSGLRQIRDNLANPSRPLPHLSMGMTQDFEEAILEGATLIRVGRALHEGC